ncbi:hypothetical protein NQ317_010033 [Molorchus minor]|uniref:Secreted protein n=1 Tax=Molorchus minor TaxID=1323400 RepID=A0ABQ9J634_9CUCU|nr:hypothetical protein NQ317_010033 [Molorchus minor]
MKECCFYALMMSAILWLYGLCGCPDKLVFKYVCMQVSQEFHLVLYTQKVFSSITQEIPVLVCS